VEEGGQTHATLPITPAKEIRYPLYRRLVGLQCRAENLTPPPDAWALSASLYRLRCPTQRICFEILKFESKQRLGNTQVLRHRVQYL